VRDGCFVSTGENCGSFDWARGMLKGHSHSRTRTACRAAANGIHNHQNGAGCCKKLVNLLGSSRLLYAVAD
jgi:hypothetical protein